jgi:hypothetical protein
MTNMRPSSALRPAADPTGRVFVCYRSTHRADIGLVIEAMLNLGVPPWQDRRDLSSEPLAPALRDALTSPTTAGVLFWLSRKVLESATIQRLELPTVLQRMREDATFYAEICATDGIEFKDVSSALPLMPLVEDLGTAWNIHRTPSTTGPDGVSCIDEKEATKVACRLLKRRLQKSDARLGAGEPFRVLLNAHGAAGEAFQLGYHLQLNWARHFDTRFARGDAWTKLLLPALGQVFTAIRDTAPTRPLHIEGFASLATCLALGWTFREVTGARLAWLQKPSNTLWSLECAEEDSGFIADPLRELVLDSTDLAVFVSVLADVEPPVKVTMSDLNIRFCAVSVVRHRDGVARRDLANGRQAAHLARLTVNAIRDARTKLRVVQRIHIFCAAPAGLALLIGQQLNALGPIQTYEHDQSSDAVGRYVPAALLQP